VQQPDADGALLGHELSLWVVLYHEALAARLGVNTTEHKILDTIGARPGITPTQLVQHTGLSSAAITKITSRLVGLGYVERAHDEADGRRVRLSITAAHRGATASLYAPMVAAMQRLLEPFDDAQRHVITEWLTGTVQVLRDATLALGAAAAVDSRPRTRTDTTQQQRRVPTPGPSARDG
jgi:DNA-binding MarR family transcriptional regulator